MYVKMEPYLYMVSFPRTTLIDPELKGPTPQKTRTCDSSHSDLAKHDKTTSRLDDKT